LNFILHTKPKRFVRLVDFSACGATPRNRRKLTMQSFNKRFVFIPALLSLAIAQTALADDGFSYRLSGFGTVGFAQTNSDELTFVNPGQPRGATKSPSMLVDSRLGGQVDVHFNDQFSATVQGFAQQGPHGVFRPSLEWAFVRYKPFDGFSIRLGRLGWPAYLVSDYRYVGYANPWLRAPNEVYNMAPLGYFDGGDVTWSHTLGSGVVSVQALAGSMQSDVAEGGTTNARRLYGSYLTYEVGDFRIRAGASTSTMFLHTNWLTGLLNGLEEAGFAYKAKSLDPNNKRGTFSSLGGTYDAHKILVTGEYAKLHGSGLTSSSTGWYGTFGYHLGDWLPYVTYAGYDERGQRAKYAIPAEGALLPLSQGLNAVVAHTYQHTASVGVRWDVYKNIDIKAQFDHVLPSSNGGDLVDVSRSYTGHSVNVYSAVVDFVF
jgi:hypothetical protein